MARRIIGLTGGIGTGKSTVSQYLADTYQLPVLDADLYAREAVEPNSPILATIVTRYGQNLLLADGTLNRKRLGEIIFSNPSEKHWLETQIHPYVRQRFQQALAEIEAEIVVLAIPLLFEAKMKDLVTEIWVVKCSQQQQRERLIKRDHLTEAEAIARINSQLPLEEKIAAADLVLDNSSTRENLLRQIDTALKQELPRKSLRIDNYDDLGK